MPGYGSITKSVVGADYGTDYCFSYHRVIAVMVVGNRIQHSDEFSFLILEKSQLAVVGRAEQGFAGTGMQNKHTAKLEQSAH